jgi:predicted ATPase
LPITSAEVPPKAIYATGNGTFAFRGTVSRLIETHCDAYIANHLRW